MVVVAVEPEVHTMQPRQLSLVVTVVNREVIQLLAVVVLAQMVQHQRLEQLEQQPIQRLVALVVAEEVQP